MNKSEKIQSVGSPSITSWIMEEYYELIVSISLIIIISALAQLTRAMLAKLFVPQSWIRILANEIVATAELCATCFELGNVAENYGVEYYGLFYFLSSLWWANAWTEAYACPTTHLEEYLNGETDAGTAVAASSVEIVTGCYAFRAVVKPLWSFTLIPIHNEKLDGVCLADLSVSPLVGSLIEGGGTFLYSVLAKRISRGVQTESVGLTLNSMLDTLLVVLAYNYSGGYFNPILATSMQYGCDGAGPIDHFIVYWIGGILGTLGGIFIDKLTTTSLKED